MHKGNPSTWKYKIGFLIVLLQKMYVLQYHSIEE